MLFDLQLQLLPLANQGVELHDCPHRCFLYLFGWGGIGAIKVEQKLAQVGDHLRERGLLGRAFRRGLATT
jgi:hypothetical protein